MCHCTRPPRRDPGEHNRSPFTHLAKLKSGLSPCKVLCSTHFLLICISCTVTGVIVREETCYTWLQAVFIFQARREVGRNEDNVLPTDFREFNPQSSRGLPLAHSRVLDEP